MPDALTQQQTAPLSAAPPAGATLLDVVAQNHLVPDAYIVEARQKLGPKLTSPRANLLIEEYLVKHHYITSGVLAKAYANLFQLPYVPVGQLEIPKEVIELIPHKMAKRYSIVVYEATGTIVKIALARPGLLKATHHGVFADLAAKRGIQVELAITSPEQLEEALNWYHWQRPVGRIRLFDHHLDPRALVRLDQNSALRLHLVVYEEVPTLFGSTPIYRVATDLPKNRELEKLLHFLEQKNKVVLALYQTNTADLELVLQHYSAIVSEPAGSVATAGQIIRRTTVVNAPPVSSENTGIVANKPKVTKGPFDWLTHLFHHEPAPAKSLHPVALADKPELIQVTPVKPASSQATAPTEQAAAPTTNGTAPPPPPPNQKYIKTKSGLTVLNIHLQTDGHAQKKKAEAPAEVAADLGQLLSKDVESKEELESILLEAQVPKIVAAYLSYALKLEASDIHLEAEEDAERVRFRVDGILQDIVNLPIEFHPAVVSRIKILSNLKIDETRLPQDGRFDVNFNGRQVDLRVSVLPTAHGEKIVMRILDKNKGILSIEELGFMGKARTDLEEAISKPYGVVLATGPTGSGKSTTLYALLAQLSKPGVNVSTLEDPIEFEIPGINQSQVKPQIGFSFAEGLRSLMRQDPNIIMVGEIRDLETATNATHAALTGHLVLSTLHTNDAAGALPRLIAMGVEPFLITSSINAIIGQRLVRKICKECKTEIQLAPGLLKDVEKEVGSLPPTNKRDLARVPRPFKFYAGKGCSHCKDGYKGRMGIYEVLPLSIQIENLANKNSPADAILREAQQEGMLTMKQDGYLKALAGITTIDEVLREAKTD